MEKNNKLKEQLCDNSLKWYPFDKNINYKIIKNFSKNKLEELKEASENIELNDKILILMENNLSIKSACQDCNNVNDLYNRREIEELLDDFGLKYRKFYYLLPDLDTTNVVFTDLNLPSEETIERNLNIYEKQQLIINEQNELFVKLIRQDKMLFKIFANSFFIECSKSEFEDNEIEFVSFSNLRKEEYRIQTTIKRDFVYKKAFSEKSEEHINRIKNNIDLLNELGINTLDKYDNEKIISEYKKNEITLDRLIREKIINKKLNEALDIAKNLFEYLKNKLNIASDIEDNIFDKYNIKYNNVDELTFVENGFWDMIFKNVFLIDNEFYFYDQEWRDNKVPIEFIIYRAFRYIDIKDDTFDYKMILKEFNITEESIKLFDELENEIQFNITDKTFWEYYINTTTYEQMKKDRQKITDECKTLLNEKDARIKFLEDNMEKTVNLLQEKEKEISSIINSKSWKITEPLRKISRGSKDEKKR